MAEAEAESPPKSSTLKIVLIIFIPILLIGSTLAGLYLGGVFGGGGEEEDVEEVETSVEGPATYIPLDPAFVVNFAQSDKARFLQVTAEVMTRDPLVEEQIKIHMPVIRNNLVLLLSSQTYDSVSTLEGKEALREEALEVVQGILEEETGDPGIEAIYFTSFVMQ
ncbi:flagellar basal body-associated FliL family protein [Kaarinaea lacus]